MSRVDISYKTIVFTVFFILGLWTLYLLRMVLVLWFISFILMTAMNPAVSLMEKIKIPRSLAILISFIIFGFIVGLVISGIVPPFIEQTAILAKNLSPSFSSSYANYLDIDFLYSQLELISSNALGVLKIAIGAASNILNVFSLIVFTFYLLMERKQLPEYIKHLFGRGDNNHRAQEIIDEIESKLGGWVRGEIALMIIVGFFTYIGLILLNIPFALPLALLAGMFELIPNIGPTISAIPAILVGLAISPTVALGVLILFIVIQQLENNIIVPVVMRGAVGIRPIVTLGSLMVGLTLGGVTGAILAVPIYITLEIIIKNIILHK